MKKKPGLSAGESLGKGKVGTEELSGRGKGDGGCMKSPGRKKRVICEYLALNILELTVEKTADLG
jgi:hypothetical protein